MTTRTASLILTLMSAFILSSCDGYDPDFFCRNVHFTVAADEELSGTFYPCIYRQFKAGKEDLGEQLTCYESKAMTAQELKENGYVFETELEGDPEAEGQPVDRDQDTLQAKLGGKILNKQVNQYKVYDALKTTLESGCIIRSTFKISSESLADLDYEML